MIECRYCGAYFEDEDELLTHLAEEHDPAELSRIDRRRIEGTTADDSGGIPSGAIAGIGISVVVLVGLLAAIVLIGGQDAGDEPPVYTDDVDTTPTSFQATHEHGLMEVTIEGETFDFANDSSLIEADPYWFHFHGGNNVWHTHGESVTIEYALATLGIEVDEGGSILRYEGEVYDARDDDTTISITVDGVEVDPTEHVLNGVSGATEDAAADGDVVEVIVETTD